MCTSTSIASGRFQTDVLAELSDEDLAAPPPGVPAEVAAVMRGARTTSSKPRGLAASVLEPPTADATVSPETLTRFAELRAQFPETVDKDEAKTIVRELKSGRRQT